MRKIRLCKCAKRWIFNTPDRALNRAYDSAVLIRNIEAEWLGVQENGANTFHDDMEMKFIVELCFKKYIRIIRLGLAEFKYSYSILGTRKSDYIKKLKLIDEILDKYMYISNLPSVFSLFQKPTTNQIKVENYSSFVTIEIQANEIISE